MVKIGSLQHGSHDIVFIDFHIMQAGILAIWKADQKGRLQQSPLYQHDASSAITACIFKPPPSPE